MTLPALSLIPTQTYAAGAPQALSGRNVGLHTKPNGAPNVVVVPVTWGSYGVSGTNFELGVDIDLSATNQSQPAIDAIRSVKIDNSYNPVPVFLRFSDTGDVVTCPSYAIVQTPVLTNGLQATLYGTGFFTGRPPTTTIEFFNGSLEPLFIPGTLIDHVQAVYAGRSSSVVSGAVAIVNLTFPVGGNPKLLAPTPTRLVAALIASRGTAAGIYSTIGASFNGVPAVIFDDVRQIPTPPTTYDMHLALAYALVPTGTQILAATVTYSTAIARVTEAMFYSIDNYTNIVPQSEWRDSSGTSTNSLSAIAQVIPGMAAIFAEANNAPIGSATWTGAEFDDIASGNTLEITAAHQFYDVVGAKNVNIPGNALLGAGWI